MLSDVKASRHPYPQTLETVLIDAVNRYGVDSAVSRYETLRADIVSERYYFSEAPLTEAARRPGARGKTAEAIALLHLNQRYYPGSANIDDTPAELYRQRGERNRPIAEYRVVLAKRPGDRRAAERLNELEGGSSR